MGCVLTALNPDVWPPSNPPGRGTAVTGCRLWHNGLCFNGFQSGRVAALKRSGGVPLPLALLGASKLAFSLFSSTLWHNGLCFNSSQSGRLAAHAPPPIERGKGYPSVIPCCLRTWVSLLAFGGIQPAPAAPPPPFLGGSAAPGR